MLSSSSVRESLRAAVLASVGGAAPGTALTPLSPHPSPGTQSCSAFALPGTAGNQQSRSSSSLCSEISLHSCHLCWGQRGTCNLFSIMFRVMTSLKIALN